MALLGAPERCVHVGDRESDIYEPFCLEQHLGTNFLVRVQTNRLAEVPAAAAERVRRTRASHSCPRCLQQDSITW